VLVLLPPSEGKAATPRRGRPIDLADLSFPELTPTRSQVVETLVGLCRDDAERAATVLGLGPTQRGEVDVDARLLTSPTRPARELYTGVLYGALGLGTLPAAATRRASSRLVITSGLWGLVRPGDRLPRYRLPGTSALPGLGPLAAVWRGVLDGALVPAAGRGVVLDLRSTAYATAWTPVGALARRTLTVRVLHERDGVRRVVSEANKTVKGRLTRALMLDGSQPTTVDALLECIRGLGREAGAVGWEVVDSTPTAAGTTTAATSLTSTEANAMTSGAAAPQAGRRTGGTAPTGREQPRRVDLVIRDAGPGTATRTLLAGPTAGPTAGSTAGSTTRTRTVRSTAVS